MATAFCILEVGPTKSNGYLSGFLSGYLSGYGSQAAWSVTGQLAEHSWYCTSIRDVFGLSATYHLPPTTNSSVKCDGGPMQHTYMDVESCWFPQTFTCRCYVEKECYIPKLC